MTIDEAIQGDCSEEAFEVLKNEILRLHHKGGHWPVTGSGTSAQQDMELWHPKWGPGRVRMTVRGECWFTDYQHGQPLAACVRNCYDTPEEAEENK
jgi:hypothetical protein